MLPPKYNRTLLQTVRRRALRNGRECTITAKDIVIPSHCPILGVEFSLKTHQNKPSIDRIDNNKGYTPDNIWVISVLANQMKSEASTQQLVKFAQWVIEKYCWETND